MYEIFKKILPVAEEIGTILTVRQDIKDKKCYTDDKAIIKGTTPDGRSFELVLKVEDKEDAS